ncbi:MAG TPA: flavodoxin [Candidatus Sabulitectum sp.]|nr:flavodoxin [Candidatus Sabulitectum sp.]HPJ28083.1 flavodoxin [Candidatus Sabulitectum sp.]HPR21270.1 flavodoxin [Candidatus Sabulitectum sp.]
MKTLVVYYSLEGNTKLVADAVANALEADTVRLVPADQPSASGAARYFWGGRAAIMKKAPKLEPLEFIPEEYDLVFLGTPVWAWTFAPPIRSFLRDHDLSGKKVALFCCHGGGPGKAIEKLESAVSGEVVSKMLFRDPLSRDTENQLKAAGEWADAAVEKARS